MRLSQSAGPDLAFLTRRPFAHRGLHGRGRIENSRAAFVAAMAGGYGIELDVQAARCGTAMVFHDATLERLTDAAGRLDAIDAATLKGIALRGTGETIPRLADMLALVGGRAPLLIEVKTDANRVGALCAAVARDLRDYSGEAAVMAFNPRVPRWFAAHAPERARGLVASEHDRRRARGALATRLIAWAARPHFVALDVRDLPSAFSRSTRARGRSVLTWTIRTPADHAVAAAHADQAIFEQPA